MKKLYCQPEIVIITIENTYLLNSSIETKQCDCETYYRYGGCIGCRGNCGCNIWDSEAEEIIPGC